MQARKWAVGKLVNQAFPIWFAAHLQAGNSGHFLLCEAEIPAATAFLRPAKQTEHSELQPVSQAQASCTAAPCQNLHYPQQQ